MSTTFIYRKRNNAVYIDKGAGLLAGGDGQIPYRAAPKQENDGSESSSEQYRSGNPKLPRG